MSRDVSVEAGEPPGWESPIFIGGLAHSGKTQVRLAIDAHPDIATTRRTKLWSRFYGRFGDLRDRANLDRALDVLVADPNVQQLRPNRDRIRREFLAGPLDDAHLLALFHQQHAERLGARRWGDQLGFVEHFADPIFAAFPDARMIHMVRDPRPRERRAERRAPARLGKLGWETAMWLRSAELAARNRDRYPGRYAVICYETLAARPHDTIAALCELIGERYLAPMRAAVDRLRFDEAEPGPHGPAGSTASSFVERYAAHALVTLGYRSRERTRSTREHVYVLADWPLNRAGMVAWHAVEGRRLARRARVPAVRVGPGEARP